MIKFHFLNSFLVIAIFLSAHMALSMDFVSLYDNARRYAIGLLRSLAAKLETPDEAVFNLVISAVLMSSRSTENAANRHCL